jgi:hypothetical protein
MIRDSLLTSCRDLPASTQYGAGCQAFFYIDRSGDFLPLAVKPIVKGRENAALVYTPKDKPADWLLAKMLLNQNDGYHSTWAHVGQSHSAAEAPYLAAIRSLSDDHPVVGILNRSMSYFPSHCHTTTALTVAQKLRKRLGVSVLT